MKIKALTVRQPWASLIALGAKQMETRTRDTKVRGPVAIHAGLAMPCRRGERVQIGDYEIEHDKAGLLLRGESLSWPYRLPMGQVVAVVELFQTRRTTSIEHAPSNRERALGDHGPGRFAWSLASVSPVRAYCPAKGRLGWWDWDCPDEVVSSLRYPGLVAGLAQQEAL